MTNNFQPAEGVFDDVEGHGRKGPGIEPEATDDVEGHWRSRPLVDGDDVEGHAAKLRP